jgi:hypothetical protein
LDSIGVVTFNGRETVSGLFNTERNLDIVSIVATKEEIKLGWGHERKRELGWWP